LICSVGFDWGETLIDPREGYEYTKNLIKEILLFTGKSQEIVNKKLALFDELVRNSYYDEFLMDGLEEDFETELWKKHYKFKHLMETEIEIFYCIVFDNNLEAVRYFTQKRFGYIKLTKNWKNV